MAKRLQVILHDPEYREIQRMARSRHLSIAEWVRQALDLARRQEPVGDVCKKLQVIRAATQTRVSCQRYPRDAGGNREALRNRHASVIRSIPISRCTWSGSSSQAQRAELF